MDVDIDLVIDAIGTTDRDIDILNLLRTDSASLQEHK